MADYNLPAQGIYGPQSKSLAGRLSANEAWRIPYRQMAAQEALGLTEGMSDITEQFGRQRQELAQKTQDKFGGGHVSGFGLAADRAERKAKENLFRASAERGMQMAAREADQAMKYSQFDRTLEHQTAMREMDIAARSELVQYEAAQRQLARDLQEKLFYAKSDLEERRLKQQANQFASQLKQRAREAAEQIAASQQRRGAGGGGGMTASYSSGADTFAKHLGKMIGRPVA